MENIFPAAEQLASACNADGEFRLAARFWNGGLRLVAGEQLVELDLDNGAVKAQLAEGKNGIIELAAPSDLWKPLLSPVPPRFYNDIFMLGPLGMEVNADPVLFAQYYPAVMRVVELIRGSNPQTDNMPVEAGPTPRHDSPVGRYIHLDILGSDHRVYYESAGQGIPLLLQHTAGCHGGQWRHLMECSEITDHYQLIAYDLPFHGKSIPPVGKKWWADEYQLTAEFVRAVPVTLATALELDSPVFMGCSVGGVLALDLARYHPEHFRAVISVEGALNLDDPTGLLDYLWHPQVSNEFKARAMNSIMSPTSPEAYRKETSQVYASGWPPVFLGDLNYYRFEYDLREEASNIDTAATPVYILSGEYDASGTLELGEEAHKAIAGSKWVNMSGLGHFPMSENPEKFLHYLLPVLAELKKLA
jgi:pimeloyl-ACP methyl ester carboxylesterase